LRTESLHTPSLIELGGFYPIKTQGIYLALLGGQGASPLSSRAQSVSEATTSHRAARFYQLNNHMEVSMTRYAGVIALAAFLTFGIGTAVSFAGEPSPAEQKDKKGMTSGKAEDSKKKDEKKDMGGK
jgi:hypothetical protein